MMKENAFDEDGILTETACDIFKSMDRFKLTELFRNVFIQGVNVNFQRYIDNAILYGIEGDSNEGQAEARD